jgi:uncharacterized protein
VRSVLVDAGPLIALFAPDDKHHSRFDGLISALANDGLRPLTTWPCIVEACYLLGTPQRFELLQWVELGGTLVYPFESHHLGDMIRWMRRYTESAKREMDLADASLYWLAHEMDVTEIITVAVGDFSRYRLRDGRRFKLL